MTTFDPANAEPGETLVIVGASRLFAVAEPPSAPASLRDAGTGHLAVSPCLPPRRGLQCLRFPRFTARETGNEAAMGLLWLLILLLIVFALVGGFAVNSWLFVILIIALVLLLVGYV